MKECYYFKVNEEDAPKYIQIYEKIKSFIEDGLIGDGEKLPSMKELSKALNVNKITIVNAYKMLENEGLVVSKVGSGTFVKRRDKGKSYKKIYSEMLKKTNEKDYINFHGEGALGEGFDVESFKDIINHVLNRDGIEALTNQESLGYEGLRKSISSVFWKDEVDFKDIMILSGAQQGIDIVGKAIINIRDNVVLEKPTYSGAISIFTGRRANILEVPMEKDGFDVEVLKKICKSNKVKCFYTMSYFQNPTCISCSLEKKKELLNLAQIYDFYIIEDDYLSELQYENDKEYVSLKSIDIYDRVIYIKSFSKIFLPGIRLGYMITPKKLKDTLQNWKVNTDIATSSLMQRALELYIRRGYWNDYIIRLNKMYKEKYNYTKKMLQQLEDFIEFDSSNGGLNFFIRIKECIKKTSLDLFIECRYKGVLITPGIIFFKNEKEGLKSFRLNFGGCDKEQIEEGINILKGILLNKG